MRESKVSRYARGFWIEERVELVHDEVRGGALHQVGASPDEVYARECEAAASEAELEARVCQAGACEAVV